jgi:hypothetical protein
MASTIRNEQISAVEISFEHVEHHVFERRRGGQILLQIVHNTKFRDSVIITVMMIQNTGCGSAKARDPMCFASSFCNAGIGIVGEQDESS